jgi:two-component system LytT family response regulator
MLKAIIIDDEIRSISVLTEILNQSNDSIEVVGTALNVKAGIDLIKKTQFDILFLDIEMPDGTGFDLLDALDEINFDIIFITAFNQYAIKAFRYAALDYLMKPINPIELRESIEKVKNNKNKEVKNRINLLLENHKDNNQFEKLAIATTEGVFYFDVANIIRCQAEGSYTRVFVEGKKSIIASKSIKEYENLLPQYFFRVHKSHLINSNFVIKFNGGENSFVLLKDRSEISVSRRRKQLVQEKLTLIQKDQ